MLKKIIIFVMSIFMLCGCVSQSNKAKLSTNDFEKSGTSEVTEYYSFSHGIKDKSIKSFTYNGKPLEVDYNISNDGKEIELGIMVFINGIAQEFSVNDKKNSMYIAQVKKGESSDFTIKVDPNFGVNGESYNMNFITVFYPNKIPKNKGEYGNYHNISQSMKYRVKYESTANSDKKVEKIDYRNQEMTKTDLSKYIDESKNGQKTNLLNSNNYCEVLQNGEQIDLMNKNTITELRLCGIEGRYSVVKFEDMNATVLGEVSIKKNEYSIINQEIGDITNYFVILIPLDEGDESIITQSERYVVL